MDTIAAKPNAHLSPRARPMKGRPRRRVALLWPRAGRVMISERMRLNTQGVVAVRLDQQALSNVWWPIRLHRDDETLEKILALWLNSTLGLTLFLSQRVPTEGPWGKFKKPLLERLLVLDPTSLSEHARELISQTYDAVADLPLLPMPAMERDEIRAEIDASFAKALGIPDVQALRRALAREPVISGTTLRRATSVSSITEIST